MTSRKVWCILAEGPAPSTGAAPESFSRHVELLMTHQDVNWDAVWILYRDHAAALHRIGVGLTLEDRRIPQEEARDLVHSFVLQALPRVERITATFEKDRREKYLKAAFRNFVRSWARDRVRYERALKELGDELAPRSHGSSREDESIPLEKPLEDVLPDVPAKLSRAAALFLGVSGPAHSIREIAREMRTTRYGAMKLVLDGLLAVAIRLGRKGALSDGEVESCRLVILEGRSIGDAARDLGLSSQQVRGALSRAREVVAAAVSKQGRRQRRLK